MLNPIQFNRTNSSNARLKHQQFEIPKLTRKQILTANR